MTSNFYPILAAFVINLILTIYSIKSYSYLVGIPWDKFVRRLGFTIAIKFVLLIILSIIAHFLLDIANIYFVLSFSIFMMIQITIEIWYLVKMSKQIKE